MITKTTFIADIDRIDYAEFMTNEELWMLFRKILQHENWVEEIELPLDFRFVREKIRKKLDEHTEKWLNKIEDTHQKRSEAWKKHKGNQYTKWDEKRNSSDKAQKNTVEQMGQNGTNGTMSDIHTLYTSSKKEEKKKRKEEMLESFRKDDRLTPYMDEEDVCKWWDYKEWTKKPYKDTKSFITMLVTIKNVIAKYWWVPKSDRNRRNRFSFMVMTAIDKQREWLDWYDSMETKYQVAKDDLYPNPKQNE